MRKRAVTVRQIPGTLDKEQRLTFRREMESCLLTDRPRLVLDCSDIGHVNLPLIHLLLICLEEAIKRNGDIKLAAIAPEAKQILEQMGVAHLFEAFDSVVDAVNSFRRFQIAPMPHSAVPAYSDQGSESAA